MNPELQRYVWLELTPQRVLVTPVLLFAAFSLSYLLGGEHPPRTMAVAGYWIVCVVGVFWGSRAAGEAVSGEVLEGTWDQQRLSSLGPWSMTWSKLLGAPLLSWYACVPCLVLIALGARPGAPIGDAVADAVLLAMIVLFCHAMGLMASLHLPARARTVTGRSSRVLQLAGLVCAAPMLAASVSAFSIGWGTHTRWFEVPLPWRAFVLCSAAAFTAWAVLGCYRLMRAELQLRNAPWVWIAFVVFCMVYVAGWSWSGEPGALVLIHAGPVDAAGAALISAHVSALGLGYLMLLFEPKDPVAWWRMLTALRHARLLAAYEEVPRWACVVPLAAVTALAAWMADSAGKLLCASSLLFFVRDAGLVLWLNLGVNRARADTAAVLYLAALYVLAPAVVLTAEGSPAGWLVPAVHGSVLLALLPAALQAALLWAAVRVRWQRWRVAFR